MTEFFRDLEYSEAAVDVRAEDDSGMTSVSARREEVARWQTESRRQTADEAFECCTLPAREAMNDMKSQFPTIERLWPHDRAFVPLIHAQLD